MFLDDMPTGDDDMATDGGAADATEAKDDEDEKDGEGTGEAM